MNNNPQSPYAVDMEQVSIPVQKQPKVPTLKQVENERRNLKRKRQYNRAVRSTIYILVVVAAVAVLIATVFLPVLQVSGTSMEPTLVDGDIILLVKTENFRTGDLCGFYWQNNLLLKRVIGVAGDYVDIDHDGTVYVNGVALDEPYVYEKSLGECDIDFPYQVPEGRVFVLGDHRRTSIDSRSSAIGCIEIDQIVGRVVWCIWPVNHFGDVD